MFTFRWRVRQNYRTRRWGHDRRSSFAVVKTIIMMMTARRTPMDDEVIRSAFGRFRDGPRLHNTLRQNYEIFVILLSRWFRYNLFYFGVINFYAFTVANIFISSWTHRNLLTNGSIKSIIISKQLFCITALRRSYFYWFNRIDEDKNHGETRIINEQQLIRDLCVMN